MRLKYSILWPTCLVAFLCACSRLDPDEEGKVSLPGPVTVTEEKTLIGTLEMGYGGLPHLKVGYESGLYLYQYKGALPSNTPRRVMGRFIVYPEYKITHLGYYADIDWMEDIEPGSVVNTGEQWNCTSDDKGDKGDKGNGQDGNPPDGDDEERTIPGDSMDVLDDWMTCLQDGYLTIHYEAWWGDGSIRHEMKMEAYAYEDSYVLALIHDAHGDRIISKADALVCFDINDLFQTRKKNKTLIVRWKKSAGVIAERQFLFEPRE